MADYRGYVNSVLNEKFNELTEEDKTIIIPIIAKRLAENAERREKIRTEREAIMKEYVVVDGLTIREINPHIDFISNSFNVHSYLCLVKNKEGAIAALRENAKMLGDEENIAPIDMNNILGRTVFFIDVDPPKYVSIVGLGPEEYSIQFSENGNHFIAYSVEEMEYGVGVDCLAPTVSALIDKAANAYFNNKRR